MLISASTNPPPISELEGYVKKLENSSVDYIHCDVMDGKFVSATTFNHKMVAKIKELTTKKLDVHLMVAKPTKKLKKYVKSGADILTIHFEAYKNKNKLVRDLLKIRKFGAFAGLSFNPQTAVEEILPYLYYCNFLLVMSVVPGKSGQAFIPETINKLKQINTFLKEQELEIPIEVDGGVNASNVRELEKLGVQSVVLGNFLYSAENLKDAIKQIKK